MGIVFKQDYVLFLLVLATWSHQPGLGIQIEINPQTHDGIVPTNVNITCQPDQADTSVKDVMVIEVSKDGGKPFVILRHDSKITLSPGLGPRFQAEGHINSQDTRSSYLLVTLSHPKNADSGTFSCLMYYLDQSGLLQDARASGNLTVEQPDVTKAMTYLLDKVSVLERRVTTQEDKGSFTSAFSAGYDSKDTVTSGNTLVFSQSILDVGHDYNTTTGVYTAPKPGLYAFHLTVTANHYDWHATVALHVNGDVVASVAAYNRNFDDQSSVSTVVSLQAGDEVRPVMGYMTGGNIVYPVDHFSVFSGYLIQLI